MKWRYAFYPEPDGPWTYLQDHSLVLMNNYGKGSDRILSYWAANAMWTEGCYL